MTGMYDVHCHILPGVDDGADSFETALELLQKQLQDGVRNVILTPHFRKGMFEAPDQLVRNVFGRLKQEVQSRNMDMNLYLGCEYHVNMGMVDDLRSGRRPSLADSSYVLCEFPESSGGSFIRERCYHLVSFGYIPVLAHIERYQALRKSFDLIEELAEMGCRMQVNADSILGEDGFTVRRFCARLIKYDLLDFIGSDAHDLKERIPRIGDCAQYLQKKYGEAYARQILCENPAAIVQSE